MDGPGGTLKAGISITKDSAIGGDLVIAASVWCCRDADDRLIQTGRLALVRRIAASSDLPALLTIQ